MKNMKTFLLVYLVILGILGIIVNFVRPTTSIYKGLKVAHYGLAIKIFLMICLLFGASLFFKMIWIRPNDFWPALTIFAFFACIAIPGLLETFLHKVVISGEGIKIYSPWHKVKSAKWCDLNYVKYNKNFMWHVIKCKDMKNIKLSNYLYGIAEVITLLKEKQRAE